MVNDAINLYEEETPSLPFSSEREFYTDYMRAVLRATKQIGSANLSFDFMLNQLKELADSGHEQASILLDEIQTSAIYCP